MDKGFWDKPVLTQAQPPLHVLHFAGSLGPWLQVVFVQWKARKEKNYAVTKKMLFWLLLELDVADKSVMMRKDNDGALQPWPEISWVQTTF